MCILFLKKIYLFSFGCIGSSLPRVGFLSCCSELGLLFVGGARVSHCGGFSYCRARALGVRASVVVAREPSSCGAWALGHVGLQQLWRMGLVAPRHVGSSQTRAGTCVPCIGRRILNHCATREVPKTLCVFCIGMYWHAGVVISLTLATLRNCFELQFLHLRNGDKMTNLQGFQED